MSPLAKAVLDIEELSPGEVDAEVIVPAEDWACLVELAKAEAASSPPADRPTGFPPPAGASAPLCGAQDGKLTLASTACFHPAGHDGPHSNGRRTWSGKKKGRAA